MRSSLLVLLALAACMIVSSRAAVAEQNGAAARLDAVRIRAADGTTAWYEPAADGSGDYVLSAALNPRASGWPFLSLFYAQGRTTQAILLFAFGLLGQAMFMGRFALQWIASERRGRSVVPLGFWWLSLAGATILLIYFVVQSEPIGILGQMLGWPIYLRNVYMVRRERKGGTIDPADPAGHPVADPNAEA